MRNWLYIAETDAEGRVDWVWVKPPHADVARPVDPAKDRFDPEASGEFAGGSRQAILDWLEGVARAGSAQLRPAAPEAG